MKNKAKIEYLLVFAAFAFIFTLTAFSVSASDITIARVVELANKERQKKNLPPLSQNRILSQVAERKASDMFEKNYFAHTSPDGNTPWHWYEKEGYDYKYAGENLAINFTSAEKQMQAWMESETHKKNILNENFQEIGVAVASGKINGQEAVVTVQEFGMPVGASAAKRDFANFSGGEKTGTKEAVFGQEFLFPTREENAEAVKFSIRKIQVIEFFQNFFAFLAFLVLALTPLAFLAKALQKVWVIWESRERKVRVRYVN